MTKKEYLQDPNVVEFTQWLSNNLETKILNHDYLRLKPKIRVEMFSFKDAFKTYNWGNLDFDQDNKTRLSYAKELQSGNTLKCLHASIKILDWGGVHRVIPEVAKLAEKEKLITYLENAKRFFESPELDDENIPENIKMNSGWTKIYSLYNSNHIIYDGRVGAALAKIVFEKYKWSKIPEVLLFATGEGANTNEPRRTIEGFPKLNVSKNPKLHIKCNIRANWLIEEVLKRNSKTIFERNHRKFESALFMIGYDIRKFKLINPLK